MESYVEPIGVIVLMIVIALLSIRYVREKVANVLSITLVLLCWLCLEIGWIEKNYLSIFTVLVFILVISVNWRSIDIRCDWSLKKSCLKTIGLIFLVTLSAIIPLAFGLGLVRFSVTELWFQHPWTLAIILPLFLFAKALPEELIFRGIIQNLLMKRLNVFWAITLAAIIFGLAQINKPAWLFPNWYGIILATIIGASCGYVYWRCKSLISAVLLHFLIDVSWWMLLIEVGS